MNQRIRELAEQATEKFTTYFDGRGNVSETYFDKEKFAELLIQKCADIGERYAAGNYEVRNQILEYFGMEEE